MDEQRLKVYTDYRGRLESQLQAAYDQFDKAILTLSGGALALSIGFIKDVVPLARATWTLLLMLSWIGFALAVLSIVVSFLVSQSAFQQQIQNAQDYYINEVESALTRQNRFAGLVAKLNITAIICFMSAVLLTIVFVALNTIGG